MLNNYTSRWAQMKSDGQTQIGSSEFGLLVDEFALFVIRMEFQLNFVFC